MFSVLILMPRNLQDLPPDMASKLSQLLTNPIGFTGHVSHHSVAARASSPQRSRCSHLGAGRRDKINHFDGIGVLIAYKNSFFGSVAHYSGTFPPCCSFGSQVLLPSLDNCHPIRFELSQGLDDSAHQHSFVSLSCP